MVLGKPRLLPRWAKQWVSRCVPYIMPSSPCCLARARGFLSSTLFLACAQVHFEPVADNVYLQDFYKDMSRYGFPLQVPTQPCARPTDLHARCACRLSADLSSEQTLSPAAANCVGRPWGGAGPHHLRRRHLCQGATAIGDCPLPPVDNAVFPHAICLADAPRWRLDGRAGIPDLHILVQVRARTPYSPLRHICRADPSECFAAFC